MTIETAIRTALRNKCISPAQAHMARAIDEKMPQTSPVIVIAAAISLDEDHNLFASQVRRNFGAGGITFDLVTSVVAKMEVMELQISNRA